MKAEILLAAVRAEQEIPEGQQESMKKGLLEGLRRLERLEEEERRALDACHYFDVERIQEGYGFWNSGGYHLDRHFGRAVVAAGMDGEKLKLVRYMTEENGRHCLAVIYPGCYIAVAHASNTLDCDQVSVYQVLGFCHRDGRYQARCRKVYQMEPRISLLVEQQEASLGRIINVANRVAITPELYKLRNWV